MSIIKHVTLQKIVARDFRYDLRISGSGNGGMDWILVPLNRVELAERMNAVKNLGFHKGR